MRRGIARDARCAVAPIDDFAALAEAEMAGDILRCDMAAANPAGNVRKARDADALFAHDADNASRWQLVDAQRL
jgi:hypothetical protein